MKLALLIAPLALGGLILAVGCDAGSGERRIARIKAARARRDPPAFWSVIVVGEAVAGRPVFICADSRIVAGFSTIAPTIGGRACARRPPDGDTVATEHGSRYRCHLNGVTYAVSSGVVGHPAGDFRVSSSVHPLDGDGPEYARTLKFHRTGACPLGWRPGEATDQQGWRMLAFDPSQD